MTTFKRGDTVKVSIPAQECTVGYVYVNALNQLMLTNSSGESFNVPPKYVTRTVPADWPPQAGDIWLAQDTGDEFAAINAYPHSPYPYLCSVSRSAGDGCYYSELNNYNTLDNFRDTREPKLMRRKYQQQ